MPEPTDAWEPHPVDVVLTGGPDRIYDDNPKADESRPPFGFRAHDPRECCAACCDPEWAGEGMG